MQEAWAIHGVYPGFAWTPDNKSIVIWAKGRIRRIQIANGNANGDFSIVSAVQVTAVAAIRRRDWPEVDRLTELLLGMETRSASNASLFSGSREGRRTPSRVRTSWATASPTPSSPRGWDPPMLPARPTAFR